MFGGLSGARGGAGCPPADSKRPGMGAERQGVDEMGGGELRREPGE